MKNPWIEKFGIPLIDVKSINNYCLDSEIELINEFNNTQKSEYKIHTNIYPAAYGANINEAEIIILVSNPGYDKKEEKKGDYRDAERIKNNLEVLTETRKEDTFTVGYWEKKLSKLEEISSKELVNKKVSILEYFPYHSEKFKPIGKRLMNKHFPNKKYLPSQEYTFHKLEKAVKRGALIICTRSMKLWFEVFDSLGVDTDNVLETINKRNPTISPGNLTNKEKDWERIKSRF